MSNNENRSQQQGNSNLGGQQGRSEDLNQDLGGQQQNTGSQQGSCFIIVLPVRQDEDGTAPIKRKA